MCKSHLHREKKKEKFTNYLFIEFNDLKYGKNSLFCCNGYCHAIFTILFYESQVEELRKAIKKRKRKSTNDFFIAVLLLFYDLKYINSTKKGFLIKNWAWCP